MNFIDINVLQIIWIFSHLLLFLYLDKKWRLLLILFLVPGLSAIYLHGKFSGDIYNSYFHATFNPDNYHFEYLFKIIIKTLNYFDIYGKYAVYIIQLLVAIVITYGFISISSIKLKKIHAVIILYMSVFFFLATQNVLRQGLALGLSFIGISLWFRGVKYRSLIFFVLAQFIHFSTIYFVVVVLFSKLISKYLVYKKRLWFFLDSKVHAKLFLIALASAGVIGVTYAIGQWDEGLIHMASREHDRIAGLAKVAPLMIVLMYSSFFISRSPLDELSLLLFVSRIIFFSIFVGFSLHKDMQEVAARVLFIMFSVETMLCGRLLSIGTNIQKIGAITILMAYSGALNVLVLLGDLKTV